MAKGLIDRIQHSSVDVVQQFNEYSRTHLTGMTRQFRNHFNYLRKSSGHLEPGDMRFKKVVSSMRYEGSHIY